MPENVPAKKEIAIETAPAPVFRGRTAALAEEPAAELKASTPRVLGIDPGLSVTGYGFVELPRGDQVPRRVVGGILRLKAKAPMAYRLAQLYEDLSAVLDELDPEVMVVEQLFSHYRHVRTAILMGHARGVVLLAGQSKGLRIDELQPTEVKKAITGNGHATKVQMQQAVMSQCRLAEPPSPPDVADAIAIALCASRRLDTPPLEQG
ncbi:MAG: crossover junction endodeoxyribonuclease RuvC [Planctomycetota bacterium]|jgi:crossover junction endodeoxyribonuclease RuvC